MAIKDLAELIKKFTQKDKFKPTTVQVIRAAKNPPVPAQNEDISVPSEGERIHFLNTGARTAFFSRAKVNLLSLTAATQSTRSTQRAISKKLPAGR